MTFAELKTITENIKKGTIRTVVYQRPMKTKKGVTDIITKTTTAQVRLGVRYDNMASTKEGRANGTLPAENQGLAPALRWLDDNFIENTKNGNLMLRVAFANGNKTVSEYRKNGVLVSKEEIIPLCLASETAKKSAPSVFNIGIEKIIAIK